jgi:predicted membrane protein
MKKAVFDPARTLLTICIGFLVIFMISRNEWILYGILLVGIIGILSTSFLNFVNYLWTKLIWLLGSIIPPIILGIIFFLVVFPVSLMAKMTRRKGIIAFKNNDQSLLVGSHKEFTKSSFEKPW